VPHIPQERGVPVQEGASLAAPPAEEAKTESFLVSFVEPQAGHFVPFQSFERTRISLSFPHFSQLNSYIGMGQTTEICQKLKRDESNLPWWGRD